MTARRVLLLAVLLTAACASAWGQLTISPASLPIGGGVFSVGKTIATQQLTTNALLSDVLQWSIVSGTLPPGLVLNNASGAITGQPTQAGVFTFTVSVLDVATALTASKQYLINVSSGLPVTLTLAGPPDGAVGSSYASFPFQAAGGVPSYTWAFQSGTNIDGLTLDPATGLLSGIPLAGGVFPVGVTITDPTGAQASASFNLNVLGIATSALPGGAIGNFYSQALTSVGATGSLTWLLTSSGTLPTGLTLDPLKGLISGTPRTLGTYPFQVAVTDTATKLTATQSFSISISNPPSLIVTTTSPLLNGAVGAAYSQTLQATGGIPPYTWSATGLPAGLQVDPTSGILSGTPTAAGASTIAVSVTDAAGVTANASLSLTVVGRLTVTTTSPLPNGTVGVAYSQTLQATGGTVPYTWSATGLPAGLQVDPTTGILSGTPTAGGASTILVTVTDAVRGTANASLSLTVGALTISPATLPTGTVGVPYPATTLTVANATIVNWAVSIGTLPAGLTLNASTGVISGTPTAAGSSTFTVSAGFGNVTAFIAPVVQAFTLVINPAPTVTISGLPTTGVAATQQTASVTLSGASPVTTTGTLTLTFTPTGGAAQQFDAKFASGSPYAANFTIAAGSTQGIFGTATSLPVMIGTVAGKITIHTTLQDPTLQAPSDVNITVNPTVPVITKVTFGTVTNGTFTISVTGRSTPRDMTSALFHFALPTNTQPSTLDVTVPLTSAFTSWYSNSSSPTFGSTFTATVQFSFTGPVGSTVPFTAVTVTITNSVGASNAFGPVNP